MQSGSVADLAVESTAGPAAASTRLPGGPTSTDVLFFIFPSSSLSPLALFLTFSVFALPDLPALVGASFFFVSTEEGGRHKVNGWLSMGGQRRK